MMTEMMSQNMILMIQTVQFLRMSFFKFKMLFFYFVSLSFLWFSAEDHPRNDYPDESSLDDHESESEASLDETEREEEEEGQGEEEESDAPSIKHSESDDADNFDDHGSYVDFSDDNYPECEYGGDDEDWR